jgi:excisionase family DNA binding protein
VKATTAIAHQSGPSHVDTVPNGSLPSLDQLIELVADQVAERVVSLVRDKVREAYLDVEQAAEYLCCKPKRVYELRAQGRLLPYRDGRRLLFRHEDLDACLVRESPGVDGGTPKQGGV